MKWFVGGAVFIAFLVFANAAQSRTLVEMLSDWLRGGYDALTSPSPTPTPTPTPSPVSPAPPPTVTPQSSEAFFLVVLTSTTQQYDYIAPGMDFKTYELWPAARVEETMRQVGSAGRYILADGRGFNYYNEPIITCDDLRALARQKNLNLDGRGFDSVRRSCP
jgi:hypothetical protein